MHSCNLRVEDFSSTCGMQLRVRIWLETKLSIPFTRLVRYLNGWVFKKSWVLTT